MRQNQPTDIQPVVVMTNTTTDITMTLPESVKDLTIGTEDLVAGSLYQEKTALDRAAATATNTEVHKAEHAEKIDWECCDQCEPPELITFDCDGDLILEVGEIICEHKGDAAGGTLVYTRVARTFQVCSRTLCRASPVFKRMFSGGFAESQTRENGRQWAVELPDDDHEALAVFCHIIHGNFEKVPSSAEDIDLNLLYQITVLSDKYDLVRWLRPWASQWRIFLIDGYCKWSMSDEKIEKGLWIAWELGDYDLVCKFATDIAYYSRSNTNGDLVREETKEGEACRLRFQEVMPPADLKGKESPLAVRRKAPNLFFRSSGVNTTSLDQNLSGSSS